MLLTQLSDRAEERVKALLLRLMDEERSVIDQIDLGDIRTSDEDGIDTTQNYRRCIELSIEKLKAFVESSQAIEAVPDAYRVLCNDNGQEKSFIRSRPSSISLSDRR